MSELSPTLSKGDYLKSLEALRDAITADLDACKSMRDRAALYLRLTKVLEQIDAASGAKPKTGDPADEVAQRRSIRRAGGSA